MTVIKDSRVFRYAKSKRRAPGGGAPRKLSEKPDQLAEASDRGTLKTQSVPPWFR